MSLWCGNCRQEIFEGFALLQRLERDEAGKLRYANNVYVPPNCAVCAKCWSEFPEDAKLSGEIAQATAEAYRGEVFTHVPADSPNDPFWKSKTWSGIVADDKALTYLSTEVVRRVLANAIPIIEGENVGFEDAHNIICDTAQALLRERFGDEEADRMIRKFTGMLH